MANWDRALVSVSNTLGQLANNAQERQQEKWRAMRDENFMRLQHMLGEQSRAVDRASDIAEREKDRALRKEEATADMKARREEAAADRTLRREEGEADRRLRREEGAADRQVQMSQITAAHGKDYDTRYLAQLDKIDKRIQEINDYKTQGMAEGKFIDPNAASAYDNELAQLMDQRRSLAQERDITLARSGDKRYRKLSEAEVAALRKENGGQMPGQPPMGNDPTESDMPMAAQAPRGGSSIKVPQAPPKPPGMVAREERKRAPRMDTGADLGDWEAGAATLQNRQASKAQIAGEGAREAGNRMLVDAGRAIVGGVESRKNESGVVQAAKSALQSGRAPAAEVVQALAKIDRQRLTQVFGINEQDLAKLGL